MKKSDVIKSLTGGVLQPVKTTGSAYAPANIALCKYWGKRDRELNLPMTGSLSLSLGELGTHTTIRLEDKDRVLLNGGPALQAFAQRVSRYLDLFRAPGQYFMVETRNTIPTAAGLASSASGFAALVKALNDLAGWDLSAKDLSILARMGSGSACRSIFDGFVIWHGGVQSDGLDSYAERLPVDWPGLCMGVVHVSHAEKPIGSTDAMNRTTTTSTFYQHWPQRVAHDLQTIQQAIHEKDFETCGKTAESNALAMHATMLESWPPVLYWQPDTVQVLHTVWALRNAGTPVYATMDAGPNVKLLFQENAETRVKAAFPGLLIIKPFG